MTKWRSLCFAGSLCLTRAVVAQDTNLSLHGLPTHRYAPTMAPIGAVILFSGDGGWRSFDKANADSLQALGYWVLGVDDLRLFQDEMPADTLIQVANRVIRYARGQVPAGAPVYLAGYSFGANLVADAAGGGVGADGAILLGPSRRGIRKITLGGFLFHEPRGRTSFDVAERLNARGCLPVAFITGDHDTRGKGTELFPLVRPPAREFLVPNAGHHYDGGDDQYTRVLRAALAWLAAARVDCVKS